MAEERVQRRLAAIMVADAVGYSRLMEADEEGTLARMKKLRNDVIDPKTIEYRGRIFKTTGDGVLAVFDGAARAIRCAIACQQVANDLDLSIRAAVHTGEVELAGDEIHGLAIHQASRMMSQAEPGEVLVSDFTKVFAADSELQFEDKGKVELRGLGEPVRLHSVSS